MDKFFLSPTFKNRIGNAKIEEINQRFDEIPFNHLSSSILSTKLILAQHQQDPIFDAIQKSIPAACLIVVYHEETGQDTAYWTGSGFLIHSGVIITSNHVLPNENGQSVIKVSFDGDSKIDAQVVFRKPELDFGILSIPNVDVAPIPVVKHPPMVGEQIAVIGAPEGWNNVVTVGYVSAVDMTPEKLPDPSWSGLVFIDAQIYEGSSGSMVINVNGEVIGMVMGIIGKEARDKNIGQNAVVPIEKILGSIQA